MQFGSQHVYESMDQAYYEMYDTVRKLGERSSHRMGECVEVRPFSFVIEDPKLGLYTGKSRKMNYRFWAAEALSYIAGWGTHEEKRYGELMRALNSNYKQFSYGDGRGLFHMVRYGDGFREGLPRCYETLKAKPSSRQAYCTTWTHETEHGYESSPCMTGVQFFTERLEVNTVLHLSCLVNLRSNDMNWGLPYDVASGCTILLTMAESLKLPVGRYCQTSCSMHYYIDNQPNIVSYIHQVPEPNLPPIPYYDSTMCWAQYSMTAEVILASLWNHVFANKAIAYEYRLPIELESNNWAKQWEDMIRWKRRITK
jgi:thymidylate synthase